MDPARQLRIPPRLFMYLVLNFFLQESSQVYHTVWISVLRQTRWHQGQGFALVPRVWEGNFSYRFSPEFHWQFDPRLENVSELDGQFTLLHGRGCRRVPNGRDVRKYDTAVVSINSVNNNTIIVPVPCTKYRSPFAVLPGVSGIKSACMRFGNLLTSRESRYLGSLLRFVEAR